MQTTETVMWFHGKEGFGFVEAAKGSNGFDRSV